MDIARPVEHARNLFHISANIYDTWPADCEMADTYLFGKIVAKVECSEGAFAPQGFKSYMSKQCVMPLADLIKQRFSKSPVTFPDAQPYPRVSEREHPRRP